MTSVAIQYISRWRTKRGARILQTRKKRSSLRTLTAAATSPGRSGWRNFLQEPRESKLCDFSLLLYRILDLSQSTHKAQSTEPHEMGHETTALTAAAAGAMTPPTGIGDHTQHDLRRCPREVTSNVYSNSRQQNAARPQPTSADTHDSKIYPCPAAIPLLHANQLRSCPIMTTRPPTKSRRCCEPGSGRIGEQETAATPADPPHTKLHLGIPVVRQARLEQG